MIVVADTSPINYLVLIEEIEILSKIYGHVVIPQLVREELLRTSAPEPVRNWVNRPPAWLEVRRPTSAPDQSLNSLDPGEQDAIVLAAELSADQLIIDETRGRYEAQKRGLPVIGTLGVLREAAILGLLDLRTVIERLKATNFHVAPDVLARVLKDLP
jgi:predicted nucleic acid-binding protein